MSEKATRIMGCTYSLTEDLGVTACILSYLSDLGITCIRSDNSVLSGDGVFDPSPVIAIDALIRLYHLLQSSVDLANLRSIPGVARFRIGFEPLDSGGQGLVLLNESGRKAIDFTLNAGIWTFRNGSILHHLQSLDISLDLVDRAINVTGLVENAIRIVAVHVGHF